MHNCLFYNTPYWWTYDGEDDEDMKWTVTVYTTRISEAKYKRQYKNHYNRTRTPSA